MRTRFIAVSGIPGSGKTTLVRNLATLHSREGWVYISSGDIGRRVDPGGVEKGELADEALFEVAFGDALREINGNASVVLLDGIPRSRGQLSYLWPDTVVFALVCRPGVAFERLLHRGRSDDTPDIIRHRIDQQTALMDARHLDGWLYRAAGLHRMVDTSFLSPFEVASIADKALRVFTDEG